MCMFVFWENMTGCFRAIFACLIFLVLAGPVLIILGIVLLASQNDRSKNVLTYNNQVAAYNSYDAIFLANTDATVEGDDFSSSEDQVAIQGRLDGITLARHITLSNPYVRRTQNDYYNMTFWVTPPNATAPVVSTFELWLPWSAVTTATLYCTAASCTSNCASQNFVCARSTMQAVCQSAYVGTYSTPSGTDCRPGDACGQCTYTGQLTSACVVIAFNGPLVRRSTMYTSCNYPFSSFEYAAVISGSVELTVMSENDPWIMLESLTQGSDDFGATSAQQRASGVTLLVVGLIVTGVVGVLLYCLIQKHTTASDEHPAPPFAPQAVAPQNCEPQQMQPAYGYGPQVMYAQQAPPPQVYSPQTAEHMQQAPTPQNHQAFPAPNGHEPHPDGEGSVPKPTMAV